MLAIALDVSLHLECIDSIFHLFSGSQTAKVFDALDFGFTIIFTIELIINLAANLFWSFFTNGWFVTDSHKANERDRGREGGREKRRRCMVVHASICIRPCVHAHRRYYLRVDCSHFLDVISSSQVCF